MRTLLTACLVLTLVAPAWGEIFTDITGHPAQRAIERLAAKGIVRGADGRFLPTQVVTRLEVVLFLVRLLGISGQALKLPAFKDQDQISDSARPAVAAAVGLGTMSANTAELKKGNILYTLTTDKLAYGPDEQMLLTFIITNTGKEDVAYEYNNTQFHDFIIKTADGTEVARWSLGRPFLTLEKPAVTLAAGKSMSFSSRWKQLDQNDRPVPNGRYEITAVHTTKTDPTPISLFYQKGLVAGYPDNTFRPRQTVSRAELAALAVRAGGLDGEAFAKAKAALPVSDDAAVLAWARGSVAVALERKMLLPIDGAFRPAQGATRADAATALDVVMTLHNRYDFVKGVLRAVAEGRPATITFQDERGTRTLRVAQARAVYRNDRPATLADLRPGDTLLMLRESDAGEVAYIEGTGR